MGKHHRHKPRSKTLPSSPTHSLSSSSSSDFEFTIALSPRKSSPSSLCPADDLFYKGKLLPLHLSPRLSMVRTLLLSSPSSSSSSTTTTSTARDSSSSTDSSSSSFSSDLALLAAGIQDDPTNTDLTTKLITKQPTKSYFSRFSNVFKKDPKTAADRDPDLSAVPGPRPARSSAKDMIRKYFKKVKPFYEKLSQKQQQQSNHNNATRAATPEIEEGVIMKVSCNGNTGNLSFSGNLGCPRRTRRSVVASCPSSMRSSPSHSGVLSRTGFTGRANYSESSTMEELHSAIQGAIAHCKNSMSNKAGISNEI